MLSDSEKRLLIRINLELVLSIVAVLAIQYWLDVGMWKAVGILTVGAVFQAVHQALADWSRK